MTERAVILMPFIRSGFDTDVFHAILIRVKIKIFYQENKVLTDFVPRFLKQQKEKWQKPSDISTTE